jgi:hypothetical protein
MLHGKKPLGKPRYRWMENFKMNFGEREIQIVMVWAGLV